MSNRAKPGDIEIIADLKFGSIRAYTTGDDREAIDADNYFQSVRNYLGKGDEVRVTRILDDGTWEKAVFEVQVADDNNVVVIRISDWRAGGMIVVPGLTAVHKGRGKWDVMDRNGKLHRRGVDKWQAELLTEGNLGKEAA